MVSVRALMRAFGVASTGNRSICLHLLGFARQRVPTDPDSATVARVSLLQHAADRTRPRIHLNVIRVGFDGVPAANRDAAGDMVDYGIYKLRNIYRTVGLAVGRVEHWTVTAAQANGRDDVGSEDEADLLSDEWSVNNDGIDVFVVPTISAGFIGISPVPGSCDKDLSAPQPGGGAANPQDTGSRNDGLLGGELDRDPDGFARTFAHELGHFLRLEHNHGGEPECPATDAGKNNLMAQTRCAISARNSVLLTSTQGDTMRAHCSVKNP